MSSSTGHWSSSSVGNAEDPDMNMELDACETEYSIMDIDRDASELPVGRKRSASCPPCLGSDVSSDLSAHLEDLTMVIPHSDPIEPTIEPIASGLLVRDVGAIVEAQRENGITVANAQTILDPEACLFVANLPIHVSDQEIQMALTQFMSKDGDCFVKVNRTRSGMPFAHVQYRDVETAQYHFEAKNHQLLWNRQLRIEPANATRFLYVGHKKKALGIPTEYDIRSMFNGLEIESIILLADEEREELHLDSCVVVNFAKWGECGEAVRAYRNHPVYWMKSPKKSPAGLPFGQAGQASFPQRQTPQNMQPFQLPVVDWSTGGFNNGMPTMPFLWSPYALTPQQLPAGGYGRPLKRRKHLDRRLDALPDLLSQPF